MRTRAKSLRDLVPATFLKYEKLNCLIKFQSNEHASLLVNILFENNIFSLASSIDDPILVKPSYSALSVNFNQETGGWNVPLNKIGKTLIKAAWQEFKEKHTQKRFHGSASAVIADPRMAELILSAADLAYAKYVDRGSDSLAA